MAKHKSTVVAAASGKMANIWLGLSTAIARHGGTDEHLLALDSPFGCKLVDDFARHIMLQQWHDLIRACGIGYIHIPFTMDRFPLEPVKEDENQWEVCVHHFEGEKILGKEALASLEKLGYRFLYGVRRGLQYLSSQPSLPKSATLKGSTFILTTMGKDNDNNELAEICRLDVSTISIAGTRLNRYFFPSDGWVVLRRRQA